MSDFYQIGVGATFHGLGKPEIDDFMRIRKAAEEDNR